MLHPRRYTDQELDGFAQAVRETGAVVLRGHFPAAAIATWREAFLPLLESHVEREGHLVSRGPNRHYVTLPFTAPFADPAFYEDDDILGIVSRLVGADGVMCQLATDTPLNGSDYQDLHRDAPPLFPEWGRETPPFQLAVNFPLVDVTPENGPFEHVPGTHMLPKDEAMRRIEAGEAAIEPVLMAVGDVMIRDVRHIHRGTPNHTDTPRPMVVMGYSRRWLFRPEVAIRIPQAEWDQLSDRARQWLRFNPVVPSLAEAEGAEVYQSFAY